MVFVFIRSTSESWINKDFRDFFCDNISKIAWQRPCHHRQFRLSIVFLAFLPFSTYWLLTNPAYVSSQRSLPYFSQAKEIAPSFLFTWSVVCCSAAPLFTLYCEFLGAELCALSHFLCLVQCSPLSRCAIMFMEWTKRKKENYCLLSQALCYVFTYTSFSLKL
jgi:hypothetical protein